MPIAINVTIDVFQIAAGGGPGILGQQQGDQPGIGQTLGPGTVQAAQTLRLYDRVAPVPGTEGSRVIANFNTALTTAVADFAAGSAPIITPALLAQINAWSTGGV